MDAALKNKLQKLTMKEILGYAIHSEDVASTYYWTLAKVFDPNDLVKAKFMALSNDETLHKEALLNLYKSNFGNTKYAIPKGLPPFESITEVKTVESFMEALSTAMQNEKNAHDIYMFLAKADKENRKLFKYLAKTELGHYEALKQDFNFFGSEFKGEPGAKISKVFSNSLFRSYDLER